jgi:hypothetical protein
MKRKNKTQKCRPSYRISEAGHLLSTRGSSRAGSVLSRDGKAEKQKRVNRGCLNDADDTFRLTAKQKKNLPPALQKAILAHHRKLGKKISD